MTIIFDLDQTLIETDIAYNARKQKRWHDVYALIPKMRKYPYIDNILALLNENNVRVALVSSSQMEYCNRVLNHFSLFFDVKVGYHDTKEHKPNPEPYRMALNLLDAIQDDEVYAIGDDVNDIIAARRAGIKSIACGWGSSNKELLKNSNPDYFFNTPLELYSFIKEKIEQN